MLGDLARKLRLLGFDAAYMGGVPDDVLLRTAMETGRILVSRDSSLCSRAASRGIDALCADGLVPLLADLGIRKVRFEPEKARCPHCNTPVTPIDDADFVRGEVPEGIVKGRRTFYACLGCGRIYWVGGHWRNIKKLERELNASLGDVVRGLRLGGGKVSSGAGAQINGGVPEVGPEDLSPPGRAREVQGQQGGVRDPQDVSRWRAQGVHRQTISDAAVDRGRHRLCHRRGR
ncbi:MAG TPA: hypothetical protein ENO38_00430 [Nitrososphaeria archaeon]|nr:hypothetical protein [Nitrososphaeria archaeon]